MSEFSPLAAVHARDILNLGCGRKRVSNAVNLDLTSDTSPDVVHDLDKRPWPFADNTFREVLANDVIEHLNDVMASIDEIHRICKHGARVKITLPHYSSSNAFTDPTHRHYFGVFSFHDLTGEHNTNYYTHSRFRSINSQIVFHPSLLNKFVHRLANRFPEAYERRWAWMFPAWFLSFELEVIKPDAASVGGTG